MNWSKHLSFESCLSTAAGGALIDKIEGNIEGNDRGKRQGRNVCARGLLADTIVKWQRSGVAMPRGESGG